MATNTKTQPVLADAVRWACIDEKYLSPGTFLKAPSFKSDYARFGDKMVRARKLVLDADLTELAAMYSLAPPSVLKHGLFRSRAPFDLTWIEWDELFRLNVLKDAGFIGYVGANVSTRVGFLIERRQSMLTNTLFQVSVACSVLRDNGVLIYPIGFLYDTERPDILRMSLNDDDVTASFLVSRFEKNQLKANLGLSQSYCLRYLVHPTENEQLMTMVMHIRYSLSDASGPGMKWALEKSKDENHNRYHVNALSEAINGDFRFLIAVLGMLNSMEYDTHLGRETGPSPKKILLTGRRVVPYFSYHHVSIKLPKAKVVAKFKAGKYLDLIPRRAHEVMGHFCRSHKVGRDDCDHQWMLVEDEWRCHCGGKRWWRQAHQRGDASLGFATKDYVLESNKGEPPALEIPHGRNREA